MSNKKTLLNQLLLTLTFDLCWKWRSEVNTPSHYISFDDSLFDLFSAGEANSNYHTAYYNCTFPAMIDDWRKMFYISSGTDNLFPFGFVQVCKYSQFYLQFDHALVQRQLIVLLPKYFWHFFWYQLCYITTLYIDWIFHFFKNSLLLIFNVVFLVHTRKIKLC